MKLAQDGIRAVLIMLTLMASSVMAQPPSTQLLMLNSQQTLLDSHLSTVKPTLFMPLTQSNLGMVVYTGINQQMNASEERAHSRIHYGIGIHQQLNAHTYSQLVFQQGNMASEFSGQQGVNINLGVSF